MKSDNYPRYNGRRETGQRHTDRDEEMAGERYKREQQGKMINTDEKMGEREPSYNRPSRSKDYGYCRFAKRSINR